ncbi:MAG: hypothetical protein AAF438_01120 [Pseudomonadota bacterium]
MKRFAFCALLLSLAVTHTGCIETRSDKSKTADILALMPPDGAFGNAPHRFAEQVSSLTAGSLTLRVRNPEDMGIGIRQIFDQVDQGRLSMAVAPPAAYDIQGEPISFGPLLVSGMPFGFGPDEFLSWYFAAGGQQVVQEIIDARSAHANVMLFPLAITTSEPPGFFVDPVPNDADEFNATAITYRINLLGAKVMKTAFPDLVIVDSPPGVVPVDKMCSGEIQGAELGTLSVYETLFFDRFQHENGNNIVECGFQHLYLSSWQQLMLSNWLAIDRRFFDSLDRHEKSAVQAAVLASLTRSLAEERARGRGVIARIKQAGATIHPSLPPMILARLREATAAVIQSESETDPDFARIISSMKAFARDNQSSLLYDGVPADQRFNLLPGWGLSK